MTDASIIIRTMNPADVTIEEAEEVASLIRGSIPNFDVQVASHERTGKGVTWFEVIRIGLEFGASAGVGKVVAEEAAKKITDIFIDWVRERFKGRKRNSKRPVYVHIYGPDGTIRSTVIKNATDEPEDRTEEDRKRELELRNQPKKE